jgi:serine phosphatase RsbU (regulator of sigma subunit)
MSAPFDPTLTISSHPGGLGREEPALAAHHLVVARGTALQRPLQVGPEPVVIGRDPARAFHLADPEVSRSHCEARLAPEGVLVRDLGSRNGTFVDGSRLHGERLLPLHALLQLGRHALRHEMLTPAEAASQAELAGELDRARRYVEGLIPSPARFGPFGIEWCYVPSAILGGDALGFDELPDGRLALYVLDVCGHGVGSAMHAASVLNVLRGRTLPGADFGEPGQVLAALNAAFPMERHGDMFFTIWYGVLDRQVRRLRYAAAGHPPAIALGPDGRIRARLGTKQPPIGVRARFAGGQAETDLGAGERLYVYSDGVFEHVDRSGRDLSLGDFERQLESGGRERPAGEPHRLYDAACSAAGSGLEDDFTLLVAACEPAADS